MYNPEEQVWEESAMYRIHFASQSGNGRWYCKLVTMQYLGSNRDGSLGFSLRPIAGTQSLDPKFILKVEKMRKGTDPRTPHSIGEIRKPRWA